MAALRSDEFFAFARARHDICLRRYMGEPAPWTTDPILQTYRFTNVFREADKTTVWFRECVRAQLARMPTTTQLLGTILFRTFNRIETGRVLFTDGVLPVNGYSDPIGWAFLQGNATLRDVEGCLRNAIPTGPWVTGAYIVKTPDGMDKLAGALWIVEQAAHRVPRTVLARPADSGLQWLHKALQAYPFLGGFTAYEIVSDLRWSPILSGARDYDTWAHAGPGAVRGLNRLMGVDKACSMTQATALTLMRQLWEKSQHAENWPHTWRRWEMREVEHTLCEWDKYERVRLGEGRPRGRYR